MTPTTIYYFPIDGQGNETGEAIPIALNADGSADVSKLPEKLAQTYLTMGTPNEMHNGFIQPKDGARFLSALVRNANGYLRFRSTPQPLS